jgi:hypothetical protein
MPRYRYLTHRHAQHILSNTSPKLNPGEVRLFSFYRLTLPGGKHIVPVEQSIEAPGGEPDDTVKPVKDSQEFYVVAPQYNISPEIVDSVYPPPAEGTEARTLPHILFKDPHLL